ncbi:hypothetical protein [Vibrio vulnificus]|uniref:hypothetical protein n=1 Tax=Vibrio vulnificus TaxID=672 RepID=UPI003242AAD9
MENTSRTFTSEEFENLKRKACWLETAILGHNQGLFTIVDCEYSWAVYKNGVFLNVMSWEGHKGTPQGVPSVPRSTYMNNLENIRYLGIEPKYEHQLRGSGLALSLEQMLDIMVLDGSRLILPTDVTFDQNSYLLLKKALINAGGRYNNSAFEFDDASSASETVFRLLQGENINIKKSLQYFPTTDTAGDILLQDVDLQRKVVFEPSAGEGYLVQRAFSAGASEVLAAEVYSKFHPLLKASGAEVISENIFDVTAYDVSNVDIVIMNPPFSGGQDVKHIEHILNIIPDNAEVHAIMSIAVKERSNGIYESFRKFMQQHGIEPIEIPAGAFKESGTMVKTCVVRVPSRAQLASAA